jgi:predicted membrane chloride channel (bestrophin family)
MGPSEARNAILLSLLVLETLGFVITLVTQFSAGFGLLGWGMAALFLVFALALGYARFVKPGQA